MRRCIPQAVDNGLQCSRLDLGQKNILRPEMPGQIRQDFQKIITRRQRGGNHESCGAGKQTLRILRRNDLQEAAERFPYFSNRMGAETVLQRSLQEWVKGENIGIRPPRAAARHVGH